MSFAISTSTPLNSRTIASDLRQSDPVQKQIQQQNAAESKGKTTSAAQGSNIFRDGIAKLTADQTPENKHSLRTFTSLVRSLEKTYNDAPNVDRNTGGKEMGEGGTHRISKDLRKLFKGLGIPPQLAKQLAGKMTDALQNQDGGPVNISLTSTRTFNLNVQQLPGSYPTSSDGSDPATTTPVRSFQLTAVQVRSLDISINLSTGEFSMSRTRTDSISISSTSAATQGDTGSVPEDTTGQELPVETAADSGGTAPSAVADPESTGAAADTATTEPSPVATEPATEPSDDLAAQVQSDSTLLQISRTIQQSAFIKLNSANDTENKPDSTTQDQQPNGGLRVLQDMLAQLEQLSGKAGNLFDTIVHVNNLRVEQENGDQHLRFTVDALAPIGLTAVDQAGYGTTLYPRPDGSLAKVVEEPVKVSA